ncbi:RnfABCDGE type electron transport complex subunit G [Peptostreptococcus equinus]|uniref:Ion-translocating oxidoreductase complex subunit G n=1 Tax=Peptostreptococcus equinus TaxID=3003601 RepID=A0ABY7JLT0_9FIRM|nr:RnfABCDGE type electron transport complex subunit G [Peptostreptococcus sp. CBA3647]WAW14304.1 RnfABCDGE type electron transport complex subunit G [Peptostreptococcus sp. CBA3647]
MNSMAKIGGTLLAFSAVAALLLAGTNQMTAPTIEQRNLAASNQARMQVLPSAKEFKKIDASKYKSAGVSTVSEVYQGDDGGFTVKAAPGGYGGPVEITIGIAKDGKITGVAIGNNTETPGLGAKAADPVFNGQYKGKAAKEIKVIKSGTPKDNEIKAISGATITSKAVTSGVNEAIKVFDVLK